MLWRMAGFCGWTFGFLIFVLFIGGVLVVNVGKEMSPFLVGVAKTEFHADDQPF